MNFKSDKIGESRCLVFICIPCGNKMNNYAGVFWCLHLLERKKCKQKYIQDSVIAVWFTIRGLDSQTGCNNKQKYVRFSYGIYYQINCRLYRVSQENLLNDYFGSYWCDKNVYITKVVDFFPNFQNLATEKQHRVRGVDF